MESSRNRNRKITSIFLTGKVSATMVIPIEMAKKYGMDKRCYVTVEEVKDGILVKKLDIDKIG